MYAPPRRVWWRWAAVVVTLGLLASLPPLIRHLPSPRTTSIDASALLARIRASTSTGFSGYAESHGSLAVPDVKQLGDLPSLLGDATKMRVWWSGSQQWRVDVISDIGETDTYGQPGATWTWDSQRRTATEIEGTPSIRVPRAADLLPSTLGQRLAGAAATAEVTRIAAHRIAGRTAQGIRLKPTGATTVDHVDIWADDATGLPLQVQLYVAGRTQPVLSTAFLTFGAAAPSPRTTSFLPPPDAVLRTVKAGNLQGLLGRLRRFPYPAELAGLPAAQGTPGLDGVASYGTALGTVAVVRLSDGDADRLADSLGTRGTAVNIAGARAQAVSTSLVNALLVRTRYRDLLIAGTVPAAILRAAYEQLADIAAPFGDPRSRRPA